MFLMEFLKFNRKYMAYKIEISNPSSVNKPDVDFTDPHFIEKMRSEYHKRGMIFMNENHPTEYIDRLFRHDVKQNPGQFMIFDFEKLTITIKNVGTEKTETTFKFNQKSIREIECAVKSFAAYSDKLGGMDVQCASDVKINIHLAKFRGLEDYINEGEKESGVDPKVAKRMNNKPTAKHPSPDKSGTPLKGRVKKTVLKKKSERRKK